MLKFNFDYIRVACGWLIQGIHKVNICAGICVAVRDFYPKIRIGLKNPF